eukprot:7083046-Pyramimonas_sp.AAC.1
MCTSGAYAGQPMCTRKAYAVQPAVCARGAYAGQPMCTRGETGVHTWGSRCAQAGHIRGSADVHPCNSHRETDVLNLCY